MKKYTLEQCLEQQKKVDAGIKHNGEYMPWLAGIKEVIEMCDHLSMIDTWKKQPDPDMKQAFMELVDVFAFAMSGQGKRNRSDNLEFCVDDWADKKIEIMTRKLLSALAYNRYLAAIDYCSSICRYFFNRNESDLCYYYMGKQTLTRFRQDNGYKDGTYIKIWGGREDNEFLTDALEQGVEIDDIPEYLETVYNAAIKGV